MTWLNDWLTGHLPAYKHALNQADPRTANWFLLWKDPIPTLALTSLYFALVYFGPRLMHAHRPVQIPVFVLFTYNIFLAVLSVYIVVELLLGAYLSGYNLLCESLTVSYDRNEMKVPHALWLYYISKAIELLDTVFMILRKRWNQITFLHVFHHSSMLLLWWIVLTWGPSGQAWFGPLMNSVVHVLMYSYYGLSVVPALKEKLWWKKYITMFQLIQFILVFFHTFAGIIFGCDYPLWGQWLLSFYMIIMLVLFRNYYVHEYITKENARKRSTSKLS